MCFIIIQIICLGISIAAALALSAVNDLDDLFGDEYKHADSIRAAAGWLLFVGIAAIIYHAIMIFIRAIYFSSNVSQGFAGFSFTVSDYECGFVEFSLYSKITMLL